MFTRPTEACQRTWPPPRLLAEKTNDLGCPRPTLSATAAATSVLLHLCHNYYFSSLLSATAACFYSTNPIGHSQCDSIETWSLTASTKVSTGTVQEPFLLLLIAVTVILLLFYFCGCYLLIITPHKHTWYLSFFLHEQNFWRVKFTPKKRVNYDKIHSKLPIFCVITAKYTVNCQFFALNL